MPDTLPSVDDLFPPQQAKSVDELFPPQIEQDRLHKTNASGSFMDFVFGDTMASHVGRVMDAFGQGAAQGWGTGAGAGPTSDGLGLSDDAVNWLRKAGIFNDYAKGQYDIGKTINEAVIRPAAWGLDAFLHGTSALFGGVQAATQEAVAEITGSEQLGRDIAAMPEAFMGSPHPTGVPKTVVEAKPQITVMLPGRPGFIESRVEPKFDINQARDLKVIGSGEAGFNGTAEPAPSATAEAVKAAPETVEVPTEPPPAPDVHTLARQIAPDVFKEFDALQQRKDVFRRWISELSDTRDAQVAAQAPHTAEIADLQERIADPATTKRLAKKYQTRLDQLTEEHDSYIEAHTQGDSPDMARIRQRLMQTDFAMRDLAPQVGQAYRAAEEQMPKAAEAAPQETAPTQAVQDPEQPTAAPEAPELPEVAAEPELPAPPPAVKVNPQVTPVADVKHISQDVAQKLIAAGRPAEEAQAAGKLVASHYWARAARFNGAKGTGLDLYRSEGPEIKSGRAKAKSKKLELAQGREFNQERTPVETPAFKRWFGDSKIVNAEGNPAVVYHGTTEDFSEFSKQSLGKESRAPSAKEGFFFSSSPYVAGSYASGFNAYEQTKLGRFLQWATGGKYASFNEALLKLFGKSAIRSGENIKPVYLSIKNPLIHNFSGNEYRDISFKGLIDAAKAQGHDGVVFRNVVDPGYARTIGSYEPSDIIVAFEPNQIKSATGNRGTFDESANILHQSTRTGKISIAQDARNTITLFKDADASTFIHETGHQWLEELMSDAADPVAPADLVKDADTVRDWLGVKAGEAIPTKAHEKFARGFETYMMEGRAPSQGLARVFEQFRQWLTAIYQTVAKLKSPINDDIRDVFDRLIVQKPERTVIAPERADAKGFADLHEADAEATPPPQADVVGDTVRSERDTVAAEELPEKQDARLEGVTDEARRREAGSAQPNGDRNVAGPSAGEAGTGEATGTLGTGGSEAAAEGVGSRQKSSEVKTGLPALPEPPQPKAESLLQFLRRHGGLKPDGELRSIFGRTKLDIIRKNGMSLDRAREAAVEAGYLHDAGRESGGLSESTIVDLLEAIDAENRGHKVYPSGAEPADMSALRQERARLESDLTAEINALGQDYNEIPKQIRDRALYLMYSEGVDAFSAYEQAVMEEERARQSSYGSTQTDQVSGESAGISSAGSDHPAGGRPGSSGEATRNAGFHDRGSNQAGARRAVPESAHGVLEPEPETPAIDKAGNIRLDLLNTPEDVNAVIRETAKQNGDFIEARRGVVSDAQILDLADALGMDASTLSRRQIGQAFNAEQIVAARKLLIDSATKVRDLMAKAASGTDADVMAYAEAKQRHLMIQEQVAGITAEAGRALRAFRSIQGIKDAKELGAFLKDNTGRDLFQLRREAQLGLNLETPAQVSKFVHDSAKPTLADMVLEVWINSLLSGPLTHATNIVSNALVALYRAPETAVASLLGSGRAALGFDGERVMAGEIGDALFGIIQGAQEGVKAGYKLFKNDGLLDEGNKIEQRRFQAIPSRRVNVFGREMELGGKQVRIPGRLLGAEDQVFKSIAYRQTLNALARRAAIKEGAQGDQLAARIAEIVKNPTEAMMQEASASADYQTFTTKLGKVGTAVQLFANSHPLIKLVVPFIRTPVNIVKFAGERSPFGLFMRDVRENLSGAKGPVARDTQIARIALGTSLSITAAYLASQGLLTGGGPADPKQRALLYATGWQPYSVKIGDAYYSFSRLEPLGTLLGVAADMYEISHASTDAENAEIAKLIFGSVSKNLTSKTWLRGPSELLQAINDPDRYGQRWIQGMVGTLVPTGVAQVARVNDPYLRDARTMIDTIKSRIPGLSQSLLPRRDIWGQPIRLEGSLGPDLFSPIYQSRINNDPVNRALLDLHMYPSNPQRRVRGVTLTDAEYDDLVRIGGHAAKARLDALVRVPGFRAAPPEIQRNAIKAIIDSAHETARGYVMMRYPHIIHDAIRLKADPLHKKH